MISPVHSIISPLSYWYSSNYCDIRKGIKAVYIPRTAQPHRILICILYLSDFSKMRQNHLLSLIFLVQQCDMDRILFDTSVAFLDNFVAELDLDNMMIITGTEHGKFCITRLRLKLFSFLRLWIKPKSFFLGSKLFWSQK